MVIFTGDYKNNLDFEFGKLHSFYEKLKYPDHTARTDEQKMTQAIHHAPDFFEQFPQEKNNLQRAGNNIKSVLHEINDLFKKLAAPDNEVLERFIKQDQAARFLVLFGERLGGYCAMTKVSSSQMRNAYGQVKKLELILANKADEDELDALSLRNLLLLIPRLAYAAKREGGAMHELSDVLSKAIKQVKILGDFRRFAQFFEAILAYHKVYGGK